jgi:hypothetical protein
MGFAGRLEGIAPSDIFQIISQNKMTGTLIARCRDRTAMIIFKHGQVIEAASDSSQESLGHLLISQGLMTEETVAAAQEHWKREPDQPLGAVLVQMGAISEQTLETVVFRQIGHIVHRLMSCDDGFITFDRGETAVKRKLYTREFFLPSGVSPEYLIMERARVIDEERRSGSDRRRASDFGLSNGAEPAADRRKAGAASALPGLASWFRASRLPKAAETAVQKGRQLARSAIDRVRNTMIPRLGTVLSRVRAFSPDGRALIVAGIGGIAAGAALIALTVFTPRDGGLVVIGRVVNIRANPATTAKPVARVAQGDVVSHISTKEGWHMVRTGAGKTGWVWHKLVERKETKGMASVYGRIGCGLLLLAGAALLAVGIMRKRKGASTAGQPSGGKKVG